jgi:hypothetical protein
VSEKPDWRHYWKAILAFVGAVATNAAADWMAHGAPIPESVAAGVRWLLTIAASTWVVYRKQNADKSGEYPPA